MIYQVIQDLYQLQISKRQHSTEGRRKKSNSEQLTENYKYLYTYKIPTCAMLDVMDRICYSKVSFMSKRTPRSLNESTESIEKPLRSRFTMI